MMNPYDENRTPADTTGLEEDLNRLAAQTHPRREFTARLRGELENAPLRARPLAWAKPFIVQGAALVGLVGLVIAALLLVPHLGIAPRPGQGIKDTPLPGQENPIPLPGQPRLDAGLPNGALARLGRGTILSLGAARDGRLAVGSTAGVCVYNTGFTQDWCRPFPDASGVSQVIFNPAGDRLAVTYGGGHGSTLAVLDAADGSSLAERAFPDEAWGSYPAGQTIAWDPSGAPRVAFVEGGQRLSAWDWQLNSLAWGPLEPSGVVSDQNRYAFIDWAQGAGGESILVYGGPDGLAFFDGASGAEKLRLEPTWQVAPVGQASTVALSSDGRWLAWAYPNGTVAMQLDGWQPGQTRMWRNEYQPSRLAWGPVTAGQAPELAAAANASVMILRADADLPARTFDARVAAPLAWGPSGLFYAGADGMLARFVDGAENVVPAGYTNPPSLLAWTSANEIIAVGSHTITRWDGNGRLNSLTSFPKGLGPTGMLSSSMVPGVYPVPLALTRDGARYAINAQVLQTNSEGSRSVNATPPVAIWDTRENKEVLRVEPGTAVQAAAFSADGARLVTAGQDGSLVAWDTATGARTRAVQIAEAGPVQIDALALAPNGVTAALGWTDARDPNNAGIHLDLWDLERGEKIASVPLSTTLKTLAFSPDGALIAGSVNNTVTLWDARGGQELRTFGREALLLGGEPRNAVEPWSLAFAPDGKTLAAGGSIVTLWDVQSGEALKAFSGQSGLIRALAFRADGLALASGSFDGTILIWDLGSGPQPTAQPGPTPTPLPVDTPANAPANAAAAEPTAQAGSVGEAIDPTVYEVTDYGANSPDGSWSVTVSRGEIREGSTQTEDVTQITARKLDAARTWSLEERTNHGLGETRPSRFFWWPLREPSLLAWYEMGTSDGCGGSFNTNLRVMDLASGLVKTVPPLGRAWSGRMDFDPNAPRVAYIEGSTLKILDLYLGPVAEIPFTPPEGQTWGVTILNYLQNNAGIALVMRSPVPCGEPPEHQSVALFDPAAKSVVQQAIPNGFNFISVQSGPFVLRDPNGNTYRTNQPGEQAGGQVLLHDTTRKMTFTLDIFSGQVAPLGKDAAPEAVLGQFLDALYRGGMDPAAYALAGQLYGGSLRQLQPGTAEQDPAKLLARACDGADSSAGMAYQARRCFQPLPIGAGEQVTPDHYRFWVQLAQPDGAPWTAPNNRETWFDFNVIQGADGQWRVMDLPPSDLGFRELAAHLPETVASGHTDDEILGLLWTDYLSRATSQMLSTRERLDAYELLSAQADPRLVALKVEKNLDFIGTVSFSVRPSVYEYSTWQAGNGTSDGAWVRGKGMIAGFTKENGAYHLVIIGTGP